MKLIVLNNPIPGSEAAFRTWLDQVHIPELLTVPGIAGAQRYEPTWPGDYASMTVYELDGDPQAVLAEIGRRNQEGLHTPTDSMDLERLSIAAWTPVKTLA
jgi:hypothetical protein